MSDTRRCLLLILAICFLSLSFHNGIIITRNSGNSNTITAARHKKSPNDREKSFTKGKETKETHVCNNVTAPRKNLSFIWQPIIPGHSYIYSAHIDNRDDRKMIKVFTIIEVNMTENFNLYCHVYYENSSYVTAVKAEVKFKVGSPNFK